MTRKIIIPQDSPPRPLDRLIQIPEPEPERSRAERFMTAVLILSTAVLVFSLSAWFAVWLWVSIVHMVR